MILRYCRAWVFADTSVKILGYLCCLLFGSLVCNKFVNTKSMFASSKTADNQHFLKLGWGWTLAYFGPYIGLLSFVCSDRRKVAGHLIRLVIGTLMCYCCAQFFVKIKNLFGVCSATSYQYWPFYTGYSITSDNKSTCLASGNIWKGFDISGHIFIETYCLLIISEEIKTFELMVANRKPTDGKQKYYIKLNSIFVSIVTFLFEAMLITTTIFSLDTFEEKISAFFVALCCWFVTYKVVYRFAHIMSENCKGPVFKGPDSPVSPQDRLQRELKRLGGHNTPGLKESPSPLTRRLSRRMSQDQQDNSQDQQDNPQGQQDNSQNQQD